MMLLPTILAFGFAFLYVPILSMVVYSFNGLAAGDGLGCRALADAQVWYGQLLQNSQIMNAALLSLKIAIMNATGAVILAPWPVLRWRASVASAAAPCSAP